MPAIATAGWLSLMKARLEMLEACKTWNIQQTSQDTVPAVLPIQPNYGSSDMKMFE